MKKSGPTTMMVSLFDGLPVLWESQDRLSKSIVVVTQCQVFARNQNLICGVNMITGEFLYEERGFWF